MQADARKQFLMNYEHWHQCILQSCTGMEREVERQDYAFHLFFRLLFLYFLQQHSLLGDANKRYLEDHLARSQADEQPFSVRLAHICTALDTPCDQRTGAVRELEGIPYLRLLPEVSMPEAALPNELFEEILAEFGRYQWGLDESDEANRPEMTPAILGYAGERFIALKAQNFQKKTGSFYTPEDICLYMTENTCTPQVLEHFTSLVGRPCESTDQLLEQLTSMEAATLLFVILPTLSVLDPAVGAGNFLVTVLLNLSRHYLTMIERVRSNPQLHHPGLMLWLASLEATGQVLPYVIKQRVLERNVFGVDILQEPLYLCRLRLALSLLHEVREGDPLTPLPILTFALPRGDSLIGLDWLKPEDWPWLDQHYPGYRALVAEKTQLIATYKLTASDRALSHAIYQRLQDCQRRAYTCLNPLLVHRINSSPKNANKRKLVFTLEGIEALNPFHWCYEFNEHMAPWWSRCDPEEAMVGPGNEGKLQVRFGRAA